LNRRSAHRRKMCLTPLNRHVASPAIRAFTTPRLLDYEIH
jgi:hypothetical protein